MTKIPNSNQFNLISSLRFGYCNLGFVCKLVLGICYFWFSKLRFLRTKTDNIPEDLAGICD